MEEEATQSKTVEKSEAEEPSQSNTTKKNEAEESTQGNITEKNEAEESTQGNITEKSEAEGTAGCKNKRDEKRKKTTKKVKEVLAQNPNKDKKTTVIPVCNKGKKKRILTQAANKDETGSNFSPPDNTH